MPSIYESITTLLGKGEIVDKVADLIGGDKAQSKKAVSAATPALLKGLADKSSKPAGLKAVSEMLDSADNSILDNLGGFLGGGKTDAGDGMLDGLFGSKKDDLISSLASRSGLGSGMFGKLLPMLLPVVMGVIGKRQKDDGLDSAGVASLLSAEKADLKKQGLLGSSSSKASASVKKTAAAKTSTAKTAASTSKVKMQDDDNGSSYGWFWWLLGALALLAALALVLNECGSSDDEEVTTASSIDVASVQTDLDAALADIEGDAVKATVDQDGVVTLTGTVETDDVKESAETAAMEVDDVESVVNNINVSGDRDEDTLAVQALVDTGLTDAEGTDIAGFVDSDGVVTLTGTVETEEAKAAAEAAVVDIEGVESVVNNISVVEVEEEVSLTKQLGIEIIEFEEGSAVLTAASQTSLTEKALPYFLANADQKFEVQGHTNNIGPAAGNDTLSQNRAEAVITYLVSQAGDDSDALTAQLTAKGYGSSDPAVPHGEEGHRDANRRVEFVQK